MGRKGRGRGGKSQRQAIHWRHARHTPQGLPAALQPPHAGETAAAVTPTGTSAADQPEIASRADLRTWARARADASGALAGQVRDPSGLTTTTTTTINTTQGRGGASRAEGPSRVRCASLRSPAQRSAGLSVGRAAAPRSAATAHSSGSGARAWQRGQSSKNRRTHLGIAWRAAPRQSLGKARSHHGHAGREEVRRYDSGIHSGVRETVRRRGGQRTRLNT